MYTLKGVFPDAKKPYKKNFVRENAKQLKHMPGKVATNASLKSGRDSNFNDAVPSMKMSGSTKSVKATLTVSKTNASLRKKTIPDSKIKKGDMSEFLKRKELRMKSIAKPQESSASDQDSTGRLRDVGCQTIESNLSQKLAEQRLTVLYPNDQEEEAKGHRASGDSSNRSNIPSPSVLLNGQKGDERVNLESESKQKKDASGKPKTNEKDPYLPTGYQKGVLPKYLRERREEAFTISPEQFDAECPEGHIALPDQERKETLRMLRSSFAELVSELNKMPVRTDTLRMRARKLELEKQLTKLEEGIKVFSRPKVFVRIGE